MGRYITVNVSTEGGAAVGAQSWSNIGIVGRGLGANFELNKAYYINSPRESSALFGSKSSLHESILKLFENGASTVIAVAAAVTTQTKETFNGTGTLKEFTLSKIPAQPLDLIEVDNVPVVEGTDFTVDYGNKKITFVVAPPTGVGNVEVDFSLHTTVQFEAGLAVLETIIDIQLIVGAMVFDSDLLEAIKDHCDTMESSGARQGIYMLKNGETATTLAVTLAGYKNSIIAHKSLKDAAACLCGRIAGFRPWDSLIMKDISGLNQTDSFTPTEIAAFDTAQIICTYDPPKDSRNAWVVSTAYTLDTTGNLMRIDRVRVLYHLAGVLEYALNSTNVVGNLKMNLNGLEELNAYIQGSLQPWVEAGEINSYDIDNPAHRLFAKTKPTPADVAAKSALQITPRLEGAYSLLIGFNYSGAMEYIELTVALKGGE